jgi:hypothetical protein
VQATYSHMMPDDRDRARKAMERFFARPAEGAGDAVSGVTGPCRVPSVRHGAFGTGRDLAR